jgi:CspA family cold shock protein
MTQKDFIGTVAWFDPKKSFGFIELSGQEDIFVHFSDIICEGFKVLKKGQTVSFNIGLNNVGKAKAINVKVIDE